MPEHARRVFDRWGVRYAVLFGSQARGKPTQMSDLDIAVKAGRPLSLSERGFLASELESCLGGRVDLVVLEDSSPILAWEALVRGRLIYAREPDGKLEYYVDKAEAIDMVADLEPLLKLIYGEARHAISGLAGEGF